MLVDNNGFLVYHPDANFQYKHLIQLEPEVADSLMALGHMVRMQCKDFAFKTQYYTWRVQLQAGRDTRQSFFEILDIAKTNVFVVVVDVEAKRNTQRKVFDSCLSGAYGNVTDECERVDLVGLRCPCNSLLEYNSCENTFNEVSLLYSYTCTTCNMYNM